MAAAENDGFRVSQAQDEAVNAPTPDPLAEAFGEAAPDHYKWQTEHPGVAERERQLIHQAFLPLGTRVLDLGCGEGATLFHLGAPTGACGVDLFQAKVDFAQKALPSCRFVRASVYELPFDDQSFDHILVRDLIHHLEEPARFVQECARVLTAGGRIDVLEPSRNNPLILAHALTHRVERGELRSTAGFLKSTLASHFAVDRLQRFQAFPLHRLVYHPKLGQPRLAHLGPVRRLVEALESSLDRVLPASTRAYLHLRGYRREPR